MLQKHQAGFELRHQAIRITERNIRQAEVGNLPWPLSDAYCKAEYLRAERSRLRTLQSGLFMGGEA